MEQSNPPCQPSNTQTPSSSTTEAAASNIVQPAVDLNSTPPISKAGRKRKPNASGSRTSSHVWEHFTKLPVAEGKMPEAACNYCKKPYFCHPKFHGTSSLLAHLARCPKHTYAISNDPNQRILSFGLGKSGEGKDLNAVSQRFNVEACRKALALFVILDEQPFRIVEGEGFKLLCKQLQPQFSPPSRFTLAKDCFQLYLDEKVRLRAFFRSTSSRIALTTDCWTSIQNLNYLVLTAHYIGDDWSYHKRIISFSIVPNHKGETIGKCVEEVLREWGIRKVSTVTVDNASSNDVAVSYLRKRLTTFNALVLGGEFLHMRCCAHILNLVVNDGLKEYHNSIVSIRTAVRYVRSSPQRLAKFKECIAVLEIPCKKLVCLDVPTRWNSTYHMLEVAEKYQAAFDRLDFEEASFREFFGAVSTPSNDDWENARFFVNFLKIFYDATNIFSSSTNVSIHAAFHQLAEICCQLNDASLNLNTIFATMGFEMKRKYDKYWGNIMHVNQLLYFGVILDPRYKFKYVSWSFKNMYENQGELAGELSVAVRNNLCRLYEYYANSLGHASRNSVSSQCSQHSATNSKQSTQPGILGKFKQHLKEENSIEQKNELERYLGESCVDCDDQFNILVWWSQNSSRFPILSTLAKDVLATPVSSVASESAFSTGGRVLDTFRSSLSPQMTEALICGQNWLNPSNGKFKEWNIGEDLEVSVAVLKDMPSNGVCGSESTPEVGGSTSLNN